MSMTPQLRQSMRQKRRALDDDEAAACARGLARQAGTLRAVRNSRHIAAYLAADGEIDPWPLMINLWAAGKTLYLPVLAPFAKGRLWFARYNPADRLVVNRYGIAEPFARNLIKPWALDLILAPLVAFDAAGHRIGMGGGYYDRSLAFLHNRRSWHKPRLLGLAFEFQRLATITPSPWDIPLDAVASEMRVYLPGRQHSTDR